MAKKVPVGIPFKKGQSGNPKGRTKKLPEITKLLDSVLGEIATGPDGKPLKDDHGHFITAAHAILMNLRKIAAGRSKEAIRAAEVLLNRGYGMPSQKVEQKTTTTTIIKVKYKKDLK